MDIIQGNLVNLAKCGHFDAIVHGCNCFHTMGAGIAKTIAQEFPHALIADKKTVRGDRGKLGDFSFAQYVCGDIINAYTQYYPGADFRIEAFRKVAALIRENYPAGNKIGFPRIGCGIGGGDWATVEDIILDTFGHDATIVVYHD